MPDDRKLMRAPPGEMERRWSALRVELDDVGAQALVAWGRRDFHGGYVKWLTDNPAFNPRTVVFHRDAPMSIVDHGAIAGLRSPAGADRDHPGVGEIATTGSFPSVHFTQREEGEALLRLLAPRGYRRIGLVNADSMPCGLVSALRDGLGASIELIDITDRVDLAKALKSEWEIGEIRRVCALQDQIFAALVPLLKPGMRDLEVTALARMIGERHGSEQALYLAGSAGQEALAPLRTRHWQGRTIRPGDYLNLLIENNGAGGYYGEFARTVVFGRASPRIADAFETALAAQRHSERLLRDGASPAAVAAENDTFLSALGWPPEDRLYAHGQGFDLVERPLLRSDETMTLRAGMYVSLHPTVRNASLYVTVCDNFLITNNTSERLHRTERRLFEI